MPAMPRTYEPPFDMRSLTCSPARGEASGTTRQDERAPRVQAKWEDSMRTAKPSSPSRKTIHQLALGAVVVSLASSGCTYLWNTNPCPDGYAPGDTVDCADDYGAVVGDYVGGTVTLLAGLATVALGVWVRGYSSSYEDEGAGYMALGGVSIAGSVLYFASASGNQVSECRKAKQDFLPPPQPATRCLSKGDAICQTDSDCCAPSGCCSLICGQITPFNTRHCE